MPNIVIQIDTFQVEASQTANGSIVYTPINSSVQVGDIVHYAIDPGFGVLSDTTEVGEITGFTSAGFINVTADAAVLPIPSNPFILFSKPIKINESSIKGYYADVTLENNSNKRIELFAFSSEVVPSSK
jgi:hypothetical protein|tara:strand:+ start:4210 stop:4596 length:387 start_codon:yes stop_codon:yes gene_type:complete